MSPDTGKIIDVGLFDSIEGLFPIDAREMTTKQRQSMQVDLRDTRSPLGKQLSSYRKAERSKYKPHVGAKQFGRGR